MTAGDRVDGVVARWSPSVSMTALRKKSSPRPASDQQRALHGLVVAVRRERPDEGRADEFRLFGLERRQQARDRADLRVLLVPPVHDLADAVVAVRQKRLHQRRRARIAKRGQQDQGAIPDELVRVATGRPERAREPPRRPATRRTCARRIHPRRVVECR